MKHQLGEIEKANENLKKENCVLLSDKANIKNEKDEEVKNLKHMLEESQQENENLKQKNRDLLLDTGLRLANIKNLEHLLEESHKANEILKQDKRDLLDPAIVIKEITNPNKKNIVSLKKLLLIFFHKRV